MSSALSILILGVVLSMKHATEADHLTAVATLVAGKNSQAQILRIGVAWGIGHTLTLMSIGGLVLWLETRIAPRHEKVLELTVSLMLVALGADFLRRLALRCMHFHVHSHGGGTQHLHVQPRGREHRPARCAA